MSTVAQVIESCQVTWIYEPDDDNKNQQRAYLSNFSNYQNNFSEQSHNKQGQALYNNIDISFNDSGYVGGRNTSMNHENHESDTTYQQL